jgi:hypothetical protein
MKAINKNNYNRTTSQCQAENSAPTTEESSWGQQVGKLGRALRLAGRYPVARSIFYRNYLEMSRGVATCLLRERGWAGDIYQDAQDVASECTEVLLTQESKGRGAFGQVLSDKKMRGYLSETLWQSCQQRICKLQRQKKSFVVSIEDCDWGKLRDKCLSSPETRMDLERAIETMQEDRRSYPKLPEGVTPLDCVLDDAVAKALLKKAVPSRTLERYRKQIRETIALEMGIDQADRKRSVKWRCRGHHKQREGVRGLADASLAAA